MFELPAPGASSRAVTTGLVTLPTVMRKVHDAAFRALDEN
jgi:hypothetical protein